MEIEAFSKLANPVGKKWQDQYVAEEDLLKEATNKNRRQFYELRRLPRIPNDYEKYIGITAQEKDAILKVSNKSGLTLQQGLFVEIEQKRKQFAKTGQIPAMPRGLSDAYPTVTEKIWVKIVQPDQAATTVYQYQGDAGPCNNAPKCENRRPIDRCSSQANNILQRLGLYRSSCSLNNTFVQSLIAKMDSGGKVLTTIPSNVPFAAVVSDIVTDLGLSQEYVVNVDEFVSLPLSYQSLIFYTLFQSGLRIRANESAADLEQRLNLASSIIRKMSPFVIKINQLQDCFNEGRKLPTLPISSMAAPTVSVALLNFLQLITILNVHFISAWPQQERSAGMDGVGTGLVLVAPAGSLAITTGANVPDALIAYAEPYTSAVAPIFETKQTVTRADIVDTLTTLDEDNIIAAFRVRNGGAPIEPQETRTLKKYLKALKNLRLASQSSTDGQLLNGNFDAYMQHLNQQTLEVTARVLDRFSGGRVSAATLQQHVSVWAVGAIQSELVRDPFFFAAIGAGAAGASFVESAIDAVLSRYRGLITPKVDSITSNNLTGSADSAILTKRYWLKRVNAYHGLTFFDGNLLPNEITLVARYGNLLLALAQQLRQDEIQLLDDLIARETNPEIRRGREALKAQLQAQNYNEAELTAGENSVESNAIEEIQNSDAVKAALANRVLSYTKKVEAVQNEIAALLALRITDYNADVQRLGVAALRITWTPAVIAAKAAKYAKALVDGNMSYFSVDMMLYCFAAADELGTNFLNSSFYTIVKVVGAGTGLYVLSWAPTVLSLVLAPVRYFIGRFSNPTRAAGSVLLRRTLHSC